MLESGVHKTTMAKATRREIAESILELSQKTSGAKLAQAIAAYVVAERRTSELDAIMREVARLRQENEGVVEATVTSAHPISDKLKKQITALINEDKLVINEVIDPSVIGGVRVETSQVDLDLTVRNRLHKLKTLSV